MEVAAGERVELARRNSADEARRAVRRRPRRVVGEALRHLRLDEPWADREDVDLVRCELGCEELREAMDGGLARSVRRRLVLAGRLVRGAARDVHDAPAAADDHLRCERVAAEIEAEDVHLERAPPLLRVPERRLAPADPGVADEQVDVVGLARPALDVLGLRDVADECAAADVARDRLDLFLRATRDGDSHAGAGELARDALADPTAAAG